jgi:nucleosome binding factor SPN SPT16 subunit
MLLNEFIYFGTESEAFTDNDRYDPFKDTSILKSKDLRKTRLTLRMLNDLRKSGDAREKEQKEDLNFVQQMYKAPPPEAAAV